MRGARSGERRSGRTRGAGPGWGVGWGFGARRAAGDSTERSAGDSGGASAASSGGSGFETEFDDSFGSGASARVGSGWFGGGGFGDRGAAGPVAWDVAGVCVDRTGCWAFGIDVAFGAAVVSGRRRRAGRRESIAKSLMCGSPFGWSRAMVGPVSGLRARGLVGRACVASRTCYVVRLSEGRSWDRSRS